MEKNNSKVVAIVALVVAVVALSVGFAAFSAQLNIAGDANVIVNPQNAFAAGLKYRTNTLQCNAGQNTTAVVNNAGTLTDTVWNGIDVTLKAPGDYVTCTATVENTSDLDGFLKNINASAVLSCAPAGSGESAATASNATSVCADMEMVVDVDGSSSTFTSASSTGGTFNSNNTIAKTSGTDTVTVTIRYKSPAATTANGDVKVTLPQINLIYKVEN